MRRGSRTQDPVKRGRRGWRSAPEGWPPAPRRRERASALQLRTWRRRSGARCSAASGMPPPMPRPVPQCRRWAARRLTPIAGPACPKRAGSVPRRESPKAQPQLLQRSPIRTAPGCECRWKERTQGGGRPDSAGRSRQETLRSEIGGSDRSGLSSIDGNLGIEFLQSLERKNGEDRIEHCADLGMFLQYCLANDRGRRVDDLRTLVVPECDETERRQGAVRAIGHRRVDAGHLLGRGTQSGRGVAARQGKQLLVRQPEAVCRLESRQRRRALDKFRRGGELDPAALF